MKHIRKISIIGLLPMKLQHINDPEYGTLKTISSGTMHYSLGQEVYGGHKITDILEKEEGYYIYIKKKGEVKPWKKVNHNAAVSVEYDLEY